MKNLYIKREKHLLDPEEVLLDRKAKEAREKDLERLEFPISSFLIKTVFGVCLALFLIIFLRSFYLQAIEGENYKKRAENNRTHYYVISAPRGIIYDRYNQPLVFNSPSFSLVMIPLNLPKDENERVDIVEKVINIFDIEKEEIDIFLKDYKTVYSFQPILIKSNLEIEEVRRFETAIKSNSGFSVISDYSRHYPFNDAFAHILGYIGRISSQDIFKYKDYPLTSMVGKDGLEAYYEKTLQGKPGKKIIEVDATFNIQKDLGSIEPKKGKDLITTIDKDLQIVFYNSLKERIETLGAKGAAGIILNPKTGEILSLVSVPSFDPNVFTKGSPRQLINEYLQGSSLSLFNRVIGGLYHPGSVIKPLMALAALEENLIDPNLEIFTEGKIVITSPYDPKQKYIFNDWRDNGWVDMRKAIATSCNVYFWAIGGGWKDISGLGLAKIRKYWLAFGLDKKLGIDLFGEVQSVLPGIKWLKENRPNDPTWKLGDTYNVSIGEGGLLLTPLQMAAYISTIANDGILMQPHLVKQTKNIKVTQLNVSEQNLKVVQEGMREVINSGTAMTLKYLPFQVAGKSGSPKFISEGEEKYNALFGAYAPYEDPEIVVFVLIEVPSSGTVATLPIIEDVLQWYWDNRINGQQIINNEKYE